MEKTTIKSNKALLIAAALMITATMGIFGTYAKEEQIDPTTHGETFNIELTEEQKKVMNEARELFKAGKVEEAKTLLKEAGIKPPVFHHKMQMKADGFISTLTDEQKEVLQEARKLQEAGDLEGAKALIKSAGIELPKNAARFGQMHKKIMKNLTEEQKAARKKVHELVKAGDKEGAKAILEEAGIEVPKFQPHTREHVKKFAKNLTDEQKAGLEKVRELKQAGDVEGARELFESLNIKKTEMKFESKRVNK